MRQTAVFLFTSPMFENHRPSRVGEPPICYKPKHVSPASTPGGASQRDSRAYVHSGKTNEQKRKPKKPRKPMSERLFERYRTQQKTVQFLAELGYDYEAETMARCGAKVAVLTCGKSISAKKQFHRCGIRFCPSCGNRRAGKYRNKYLPRAAAFITQHKATLTPCLLTLTQKKIKGESLPDARARVLKSFKKLARGKFFGEHFAGGIWACESTFSDDAVHTHLHIIVFRRKFVSHVGLKSAWAKHSPGAKNLNIKRIDTLENGLSECVKYISKPIPADTMKREHISEVLSVKGQRMIDTFGEFREFCRAFAGDDVDDDHDEETDGRTDLNAGDACPCCNEPLFELTLTAAELIDFHRRLELMRLHLQQPFPSRGRSSGH